MTTVLDDDRTRPRGPVVTAVALLGLGLVAGMLTSYGQGHLPDQLHALANSSTSWTVVAYVGALLARRWWTAVAFAYLTFVLLLVGYEIASTLRVSIGMGPNTWAFWLGAGLVVAFPVGYAAWAVRARPAVGRLLSVALLAGLAVGEGVYGLTVVAATTSPVYWTISVVGGVLGLAWFAWRTRSARSIATAVLLTAAVAGGFLALYQASSGVWFLLSHLLL
ncbi:DUF6518 family protein [Solicola sp. PLA-1-18]|uniref:DUF6518 family protein n=1 Tax=Solicola sp. PLA-1-18 TaxID=3380532 RepID=UPI003B814F2C